MPINGNGFKNHEAEQIYDFRGYGTNWMAEVLINAGQKYFEPHHQANPEASLICINDVSLPRGGDTHDHAGHETGLSCDLRLPRKDGQYCGIENPNTNHQYDRTAMRAQLTALWPTGMIDRIFFNDRVLNNEGLCQYVKHHGNHVLFQIKAKQQ